MTNKRALGAVVVLLSSLCSLLAQASTTWASIGSPYSSPAYTNALAQSAPIGVPWLSPTGVATVGHDRQLAWRDSSSGWNVLDSRLQMDEPSYVQLGTVGTCVSYANRASNESIDVTISAPNGVGGCTTITNNIGGSTTLPPAISAWFVAGSDIRVDVFINQDSNLMVRTFSGSHILNGTWSAWTSLSGPVRGGPAAVSWGVGRTDVFIRGTNNLAYSKSYAGGSWTSSFYPHGGGFTSDLSVMSSASNRLDVVGRGTDNAIWRLSWNGTAWNSNWRTCNGSANSRPSIVWDASSSVARLYIRGFSWDIQSASGNCN